MLRDCYGRQLAGKWSPDGKQRVIRTMTLVSGESTTSDAATRSRYPHVLISEQKRLANHYDWMQNHSEYFFFFFRELLYRRAEFVGLVMEEIETWMTDPTLKMVPSREKVTHSVCYAAFAATARLLGSHADEEIVAYRNFLAAHATRAAADVASDVNVNVFIQDLIVAYDEEAIGNDCFKVESVRMDHPPGSPNQGPWMAHTLYVNFYQALSALGIYLRKGNLEAGRDWAGVSGIVRRPAQGSAVHHCGRLAGGEGKGGAVDHEDNAAWQLEWLPPADWVQFLVSNNNQKVKRK
jgi:hypothetical protein